MRDLLLAVSLVVAVVGSALADTWKFTEGHDPILNVETADFLLTSDDRRFALTIGCYDNAERSVSFLIHTPTLLQEIPQLKSKTRFTVAADGSSDFEIQLRSFAGERMIVYGEMFAASDQRYRIVSAILEARTGIVVTDESGLRISFSVEFPNIDLGRFTRVCHIPAG